MYRCPGVERRRDDGREGWGEGDRSNDNATEARTTILSRSVTLARSGFLAKLPRSTP